ncbi:phage/plasmid primase, P4 family [Bradyrhizobium ottawaense]|nr:phage/plasmid primase, P4 family [Bradyrhizobium ottawaense]
MSKRNTTKIKEQPQDEQVTATLAKRMMSLFPCSTLAHGSWKPSSRMPPDEHGKVRVEYVTHRRPVTAHDWEQHLRGERALVVALECDDGTTSVTALDIDEEIEIVELNSAVRASRLPFFVYASKSVGRARVLAFHEAISIAQSELLGRGIAATLGLSELTIEYFPPCSRRSPDKLPKQLNMPYLGSEYRVVRPRGFEMPLQSFIWEAERQRLTGEQIKTLSARAGTGPARGRRTTDTSREQAHARRMLDRYVVELSNCPEGHRNNTLTKQAYHMGTMIGAGWIHEQEVLDALAPAVAHWTDPDKTDDTLRRSIADGQQNPHDDLKNSIGVVAQDDAALAFVSENVDDIRYDWSEESYFVWSGTHWRRDDTGLVAHMIRDFLRERTKNEKPKVQARFVNKTFISAVDWLSRLDRRIVVSGDCWDADPILLGTPGGTVDLRTGELREPKREDRISRITAAIPGAEEECPTWKEFLSQVTRGSVELVEYLQVCAGYTLVGENPEHKLFFLCGGGGNGKGVFVGTLAAALGELHFSAPPGMFIESKFSKSTNDLASARHARMLSYDENASDRYWNEEEIKKITGGGTITAREVYQKNQTFRIKFTPWFSGNGEPRLRSTDSAMRRRLEIVPWQMRVTDDPNEVSEAAYIFLRDSKLGERLRSELPGILRWAINGAVKYNLTGLRAPEVVQGRTDDLFAEADTLGYVMATEFMTTGSDGDRVSPREIYEQYAQACAARGEQPLLQRAITSRLKQHHATIKSMGSEVFTKLRRRRRDERPI